MFAAALNSGGNKKGRELFLEKLKEKRERKPQNFNEIELVKVQIKDRVDEDGDIEMKGSKTSDSSDNDTSDSSSSSSSDSDSDSSDSDSSDNDSDKINDNNKESIEEEVEKEKSELNLLKRKRSETKTYSESESEAEAEQEISGPHSSIISRFKQTMSLQPQLESAGFTKSENDINPLANIPINEVKPLPQPALPRDQKLYSQSMKNKTLDWLTKPAYYNTQLTKPFEELMPEINDLILKNIQKEYHITNAFSVQVTLIQELLKDIKRQILDPTPRGDYLVNAATGSGKTLAYLIPIIQSILTRRRVRDSGLKCVIMVSTKPLVTQVYADALKLTKGTDINIRALRGDSSVLEERSKLNNEVDIIISTPGRLMEHLDVLDLGALRFLVVDEADKLLNQSFQNWCDSLIDKIESYYGAQDLDERFQLKCTKVILSATLTTSSEKLTHLRLFRPRLVVVNDSDGLVNELYQLPATLDEYMIKMNESLSFYKPLLLLRFMINNQDWRDHGLIFAKSNESAIRLGRLLINLSTKLGTGINIQYITSHMKPNERQRILKQFDSEGGILISTDLLSRGINFNSIEFVINYDLPMSTKEYIHRIGRTARGGNSGKALNLCFGDGEFKWFKKLVYSGGVINRNKKEIQELELVKSVDDINGMDKSIYDECLQALQREVQKG